MRAGGDSGRFNCVYIFCPRARQLWLRFGMKPSASRRHPHIGRKEEGRGSAKDGVENTRAKSALTRRATRFFRSLPRWKNRKKERTGRRDNTRGLLLRVHARAWGASKGCVCASRTDFSFFFVGVARVFARWRLRHERKAQRCEIKR